MQKWKGLQVFSLGVVLLAGCSSGGSSGTGDQGDPDLDNGDTVVVPVSEETDAPVAEFLAAGVTLTGAVAEGESRIFRVPSGAEISLLSTSGNADLFLLDNTPVFNNDIVLCRSTWPVIEDNCTASTDGELYVDVYGRTAAEFSISVTNDCSVPAVNDWVYRNMQDYYLFADQVPVVNPASYDSTRDLINDIRFTERDPFTGISDAVARQDFFETGGNFGLGAEFRGPRVSLVYDDSPFGRANVQRGDIVVSIDGVPAAEIDNARFFELIGDRDNPATNVWRFEDGVTGEIRDVSLAQSEFTINTVVHSSVYTSDRSAAVVGYLVFTDFLETSEAELDSVLQRFLQEGVTEIILDLRYNGGGRVSVANKLASQIGGLRLSGRVLSRIEFNSKYTARNEVDFFAAAAPSLDVDRLIVLGGARTASASELVINSLRAHMDVVFIGDGTTVGKSLISRSKINCGLALSAMDSQSVNANGVSIEGGIVPDCFAADDVTRRFGGTGSNIEGMLAGALDYTFAGVCNVEPALAKRTISGAGQMSVTNNERPYTDATADPDVAR